VHQEFLYFIGVQTLFIQIKSLLLDVIVMEIHLDIHKFKVNIFTKFRII